MSAKPGVFKHFLDALEGKFHGYPDGLACKTPTWASFASLVGAPQAFDLMSGIFPEVGEDADSLNPILRSLHFWLTEAASKAGVSATILSASLSLEVTDQKLVDKSKGHYSTPGPLQRDESGFAYVESIPVERPDRRNLREAILVDKFTLEWTGGTVHKEGQCRLTFTADPKDGDGRLILGDIEVLHPQASGAAP